MQGLERYKHKLTKTNSNNYILNIKHNYKFIFNRKMAMEKRHNEIRDKYGLPKYNSDIQPPKDIFSVENDRASFSFRT